MIKMIEKTIIFLYRRGGRYTYIFRHQGALALMEAHRNFFKENKGMPEAQLLHTVYEVHFL